MEYRNLGRSGLKISTIGIGSWLTFGSSVGDEEAGRCIRAAIDAGVNFIDTADIYNRGEAEKVLGKALADVPRKDYVLATKLFWPMSEGINDQGLSRKHIVESCEASLRRLKTDYVDLYQCHRYDTATPVEETVRAMSDLVRQGKILHWGVSVWNGSQIMEAIAAARTWLDYPPISNQPPYNLLSRQIEEEVLPICEREGIGQVVFSPLAQGFLTGKYDAGKIPVGSRLADERRGAFMRDMANPDTFRKVEQLVAIASDLGLTPAQVALSWCLRVWSVASVIVGVTTPAQVAENVKAAEVKLPPEVLMRLEEVFPPAPAAPAP